MPVDACLGFRKVFNVWLEHVSLRSLRRASQLQRTKHDTSADPRRAFCCHQCFKKPQDNICFSPPFYRFFLLPRGENQNCSCFISEHAWNKYDTIKGITNTNTAQLMRGDDFLFSLYFEQDEQGWSKSVSQVKKS